MIQKCRRSLSSHVQHIERIVDATVVTPHQVPTILTVQRYGGGLSESVFRSSGRRAVCDEAMDFNDPEGDKNGRDPPGALRWQSSASGTSVDEC